MTDGGKTGVLTIVVTTVITVIISGALGIVGAWIKGQWIDPFSFTVHVAYLDGSGNHVDLQGADVNPNIVNVKNDHTNEDGLVIFQNVEPHIAKQATIVVNHPGYHYADASQEQRIPIRKRTDAIQVLLKPVSNSSAIPTVAQSSSPDDGKSVQSDSGTPNNADVIVTSVCRSGPKPSGQGKDFGQTFVLCSDSSSCTPPVPSSNVVILSDSFDLTGDRRCNAWSKCARESTSTGEKACYNFGMQGHEEWQGPLGLGGAGIAYSEGVLTVRWHKQ